MTLEKPLCPECETKLEFEPPYALICPDCSYRWDH